MPVLPPATVRVRVPATSANLGPAFDCAGLALTLYDELVVHVGGAGLTVAVSGEGSTELPRDGRHLVAATLRRTLDLLGAVPAGLHLHCSNRIPQSRGLGSSSAAIVSGVLAARALVPGGEQELDDGAVLALATAIEGHPDNVAACLSGGLTLAWTGADGPRVHRAEVHAGVAPVAFVPPTRASTAQVRRLLPATVPHRDAAANSARAALLSLALTRDPGLLLTATEDLLHQSYRAPAMPGSAALVAALRQDGVPAVISGAGPTVLALVPTADAAAVASRVPAGWTVLQLGVERQGAVVRVERGHPAG